MKGHQHPYRQPARPRWFALLVGLPLAWCAATTSAQGTGTPLRATMPDPANPVHDAAISANVNAALAHDPPLAKALIDVETVNGQVALKGEAPSPELRERATRVAASVAGVVSVENRLAIERPAPISPR